MPRLQIRFLDGFTGQRVAAVVNGREVFNRDHLRTRTQISFAASMDVDVPAGDATVRITAGSITRQFSVPLARDVQVRVSLTPDGQIEYRTFSQFFGDV